MQAFIFPNERWLNGPVDGPHLRLVALIVSDRIYEEVVRHHPGAAPSRFAQVRVVMKETEMTAWVRVLGAGDALGRRDTGPVTPPPLHLLAHVGHPLAASSPGVRYSLPPDTAAFTGRGEDLEHITAAVTETAGAGVVAIHAVDGMPGVGKTTLAVHAAHLLRHRFPDRQLFIDLQAHTPGQEPLSPEAALACLLTAAGVDARSLPDDLQGRISLWRDRMAGQRAVLVLDNAADSGQVAPLLPGGGSCLVLVTSRRHLGDLPGVTIPVLLQALSVEDAWEMFVRLAPRAASGPDAAVELVQLAGFLPLAISLLARVYNRHESWTLADLIGMLYRVCDDLRRAEVCHRQALHLAREIASPWDEAQALAGLGRCAGAAGHTADAAAALRQGQEIFERIGAAEAITVASELNDLTGI